ncbi:MAG: glycosyltransferase [Pirellulales bacterium]
MRLDTPKRNHASLIVLYHYFHPDDVVSARLFSDLAVAAREKGLHVVAMPSVRSCHDGRAAYSRREEWEGGSIRRVWRPGWRQSSNKGRILNALAMLVGWTWRALVTPRSKHEVMIVGTDPILGVLVAIPWRLLRPRSTIIHWCHDVYPQAAVADGVLRADSLVVWMLNRVLRIAYRRCDVIADLGMCMRGKMLEARGEVASSEGLVARGEVGATVGGVGLSCSVGDGEPEGLRAGGLGPGRGNLPEGLRPSACNDEVGDLGVANSCAAENRPVQRVGPEGWRPSAHDDNEDGDCERRDLKNRFVTVTPWSLVEPESVVESDARVRAELFGTARLGLLYSGNFGRAHEFEGFLSLARRLRTDEIGLCFAGRGPRMEELRQLVDSADSNIHFAGFASEEELALRLGAADIHLVSLRESWTGTVVPSKFFGALAVGRPVLFVGSDRCAIAQWIRRFRVGWVLSAGDEDAVADELRAYAADPEAQRAMKLRCWETYGREFSRRVQIGKLLREVGG